MLKVEEKLGAMDSVFPQSFLRPYIAELDVFVEM